MNRAPTGTEDGGWVPCVCAPAEGRHGWRLRILCVLHRRYSILPHAPALTGHHFWRLPIPSVLLQRWRNRRNALYLSGRHTWRPPMVRAFYCRCATGNARVGRRLWRPAILWALDHAAAQVARTAQGRGTRGMDEHHGASVFSRGSQSRTPDGWVAG